MIWEEFFILRDWPYSCLVKSRGGGKKSVSDFAELPHLILVASCGNNTVLFRKTRKKIHLRKIGGSLRAKSGLPFKLFLTAFPRRTVDQYCPAAAGLPQVSLSVLVKPLSFAKNKKAKSYCRRRGFFFVPYTMCLL